MDIFNFCWQAFLLEAKVHRISLPSSKISTESDYKVPINRLRHLFNRGPFIINLIKTCVNDSTSLSPTVFQTFHELTSKSHRQICAFSQGPGLEVVGLFHALSKYERTFQNVSVRLVTKYSEWLHISETMLYPSVVMPRITNTFPNVFQLIQNFACGFDIEIQNRIQNADLILWMKFCSYGDRFLSLLKKILILMKENAILFLLDSKKKLKLFKSISHCGVFLYGPTKVTVTNVPVDPTVCENILFAEPRCKGNAEFALWKKTQPYVEIDDANCLHPQLPVKNCNKRTDSNGFQQKVKVGETISSELKSDSVKWISKSTSGNLILSPENSLSKLNASEEMPNFGKFKSEAMFPELKKHFNVEKMVSSFVYNEKAYDMNVPEITSNNSVTKQPLTCETAKVSDFKSEKRKKATSSSTGSLSSDDSNKNISLINESKANSQVDESLNITSAFSGLVVKYNKEIKKEFEESILELARVILNMKKTLRDLS